MEKKLEKYRIYKRDIKALLSLCGLWPEVRKIFSYPLAITAFIIVFLLSLGIFNFCVHHITNIMILTKGMGMFIGLTTAWMKICIFVHHRDDLIYLNENLTKMYNEDMKEPKNHPILLSRISLYRALFYTQTLSVFMASTMYAIIPLFSLIRHGKYLRMLPCIYPISFQVGSLVYWLVYICEVWGSIYLSAVTSGVDCSFGMYAMQTSCELKLLGKKFENLVHDNDYKKNIKECIRRHHILHTVKKKLENLYGFVAIWLTITAAVVLCTLIFQLTEILKSNVTPLQLNLLAVYIILKFSQAFSFAKYGHDITDESQACLDAMYNSNWHESRDLSFKKDVLIVLVQKPIQLIAKGCMLIQLDMFAKIANTSVSYFFLLQTLSEESG